MRTPPTLAGVANRGGVIVLGVALAAACAVALPSGPSKAARSDGHRAVERTVRAAVLAAVRDRNWRRACRFATPRGRRRLLEGFNSSSGPDYPNCPAILRAEAKDYPETVMRLRRSLLVSEVRVSGRRARVRVAEGPDSSDGSGHLALIRVGGRWRIDNSDLIPYGD